MKTVTRSTLIVHGRLAVRQARLQAARQRRQGLQIMTVEQMAVRLAGGFSRAIDADTLRQTLQAVLPATDLGELDRIKTLPGMVGAATDTLRKLWSAEVDLAERAPEYARLDAMARLEDAVQQELPPAVLRPVDIASAATKRLSFAPTVLGPVEVSGLTELEPCWRGLLKALADHVPVRWLAGPRSVPDWLLDSAVEVVTASAENPQCQILSAATAHHECLEALRWARELLANGVAASEIAIASASPASYDDDLLALRAETHFDLHFVHGLRAVTTPEGQAAAALADLLVRGLSRARVQRLARLSPDAKAFAELPKAWLRVLPPDAPLTHAQAWSRAIDRLQADDWPDKIEHNAALRDVITLLDQGADAAESIGPQFLRGRALGIWRKALACGPAAAIDQSIARLKQDDGLEACESVAWMPAAELAACPRPYVRLLGLNSGRWPRGISEDRLIPDHQIQTQLLDPLPVNLADRRDFQTICVTTVRQLVLSRARRDREGRLLGRSPLLAEQGEERYLQRHAVPVHAFSETDRLLARPKEFAKQAQAKQAAICWRNWGRDELTAHDGLVRADHPVMKHILGRRHSASSLKLLLRNPQAFVWKYALRWSTPEEGSEPLMLDALHFGNLVHQVLEGALVELGTKCALSDASATQQRAAIAKAVKHTAQSWESEQAIPPELIWQRTLIDAAELAQIAFDTSQPPWPGVHAYAEVAFGVAKTSATEAAPWNTTAPVIIPGTNFRIQGYIDRLDVTGDKTRAAVTDYKTGRAPKKPVGLNGGQELQRCLYAAAVKVLLGDSVEVHASLNYPREEKSLTLEDADAAMETLAAALRVAGESLTSGAAIPGPDAAGDFDDLAFALPANAKATYCQRKATAINECLAGLASLWETP